ncbi:GNAT family N-acetyltransferase [Clostridium bornimense]|uniref:GNAT family N-acetyltransferase n=1 Tax=Clostridium bornimense TaxID=1216932 RepID=UPI001C0F6417|nr:GNAT family N-acetyltransferase [Clostridium bornimense]MBU5316646.1 GNAT family N-acetyltransferase [Clostridium bornimense]
MKDVKFRFIEIYSKEYEEIKIMRYEALFKDCKTNHYHEAADIEYDKKSMHFAGYDGNNLVAYCRLTVEGDIGKISRVFVSKKYLKQGFGKQLINNLIDRCLDMEIKKLELNSRESSLKFYEKLGFYRSGELIVSKESMLTLIPMVREVSRYTVVEKGINTEKTMV